MARTWRHQCRDTNFLPIPQHRRCRLSSSHLQQCRVRPVKAQESKVQSKTDLRSGVRTTAQFNTKIFNHADGANPHLWASDALEHFKFSPDKFGSSSDKMSVNLNAAGDSYHIKSTTNKKSVVDLTVTRAAPGFVAGKDGTSNFGTDPKKPWGQMRHAFWPACTVEGSIITQSGPVDFKGKGVYIHALQGMKPHHAGTLGKARASQRSRYADHETPHSRAMELPHLPITLILSRPHAIRHTTILRLNKRRSRRPHSSIHPAAT